MAKGVLVHRPDSIYNDLPAERYQFPKRYLKRMLACEGDWIVYYEPTKGGGRRGYNAVARISKVIEDPLAPNMFLAIIDARSYVALPNFVSYQDGDGLLESGLAQDDGSLNRGLIQWSVRPLSDRDFVRILDAGLAEEDDLLPRNDQADEIERGEGLYEDAEYSEIGVDRERIERTIFRIDRSSVFRRHVLDAYDSRCAITGLKLINGGGRAEVEAAHIKPVEHNGPDEVRNGIALSGTVHWMFDRGLISLSDQADILVSRQANDPDQIWGLVNKTRKANLPESQMLQPHPAYLSWHRENCFKH